MIQTCVSCRTVAQELSRSASALFGTQKTTYMQKCIHVLSGSFRSSRCLSVSGDSHQLKIVLFFLGVFRLILRIFARHFVFTVATQSFCRLHAERLGHCLASKFWSLGQFTISMRFRETLIRGGVCIYLSEARSRLYRSRFFLKSSRSFSIFHFIP